ncbi:hypothetical protein BH10ACI2_BH10ACI2_22680 [soil metagenome]
MIIELCNSARIFEPITLGFRFLFWNLDPKIMYCPECGIEERQANQFCRACGTDLKRVRVAVETPDSITASAVTAREEIGRAVAAKIRETQSVYDLKKVAEDVLPEIEKFLESPEEKRLRRMRTGMLVACIGLGVAIAITIASMFMRDSDIIVVAAMGLVTFFIGLGFLLNGYFLTLPKKELTDRSDDARSQRQLDGLGTDTNELRLPESPASFFTPASVTENTTKHLTEKVAEPR